MYTVIAVLASLFTLLLYQTLDYTASGSGPYVLFKMIAASVFLVAGTLAVILNKKRSVASYIILGSLLLGFTGDLFLALNVHSGNQTLFYIGISAFILCHAALITGMYFIDKFHLRDLFITLGLIAFCVLIVLLFNGRFTMHRIDIKVFIYLVPLSYCAAKSFSVLSTGAAGKNVGTLLCLGVLLFAISDIALGLNMSIPSGYSKIDFILGTKIIGSSFSRVLDYTNTFTYFIGQTLIACSVFHYRKDKAKSLQE